MEADVSFFYALGCRGMQLFVLGQETLGFVGRDSQPKYILLHIPSHTTLRIGMSPKEPGVAIEYLLTIRRRRKARI
jgi:hypothetical protein